jgi:hypothetical protein
MFRSAKQKMTNRVERDLVCVGAWSEPLKKEIAAHPVPGGGDR